MDAKAGEWLAAGVGLALCCLLSGFPAGAAGFGPHHLPERDASNTEICAFCHTPQGRQNGTPVWSRHQAAAEYQTFDAALADGQIYLRGNISVACLSCHDGSQAPDAQAYALLAATGARPPLVRRPMTNDHPVGMVYTGFARKGPATGFERARLRSDVIGTQTRWWLDSESVPDGTRDKTDVIFYTRGEGAAAEPYVECSSCHDPHANPGGMFLRIISQDSSLCGTCHNL